MVNELVTYKRAEQDVRLFKTLRLAKPSDGFALEERFLFLFYFFSFRKRKKVETIY